MAMEPAQAPLIHCVGQRFDCPTCHSEPLRGDDLHVCDELCANQYKIRRSPDAHRRSHQLQRHHCGAVLDNRHGSTYELVEFCGWGTCVQVFCPGCKEYISGYGPSGCKCETDPCGHGRYAEHAGVPPVTTKRRRGLFRRR